MTAYEQGFIDKCAEWHADPEVVKQAFTWTPGMTGLATGLAGAGIGAAMAGQGNRLKGALVGGGLGFGAGYGGRHLYNWLQRQQPQQPQAPAVPPRADPNDFSYMGRLRQHNQMMNDLLLPQTAPSQGPAVGPTIANLAQLKAQRGAAPQEQATGPQMRAGLEEGEFPNGLRAGG